MLKHASAQNVSNTLWAMAKLRAPLATRSRTPPQEDAEEAPGRQESGQRHVVQRLCEHLLHPPVLREAEAQVFSNSLWALATLDCKLPFALLFCNATSRWLLSDDALVDTFTAQNAKDVLWAHAKLSIRNEELFERLARHLVSSFALRSITVESIVMSLWAYASLGIESPTLFRTLGQAFLQAGRSDEYTPRSVSLLLWANARLGYLQPRIFVELSRYLARADVLPCASKQDM
eukprot:scaffold7448_cov286-Pinguiococcus_pyrenoidosus.AAC.1